MDKITQNKVDKIYEFPKKLDKYIEPQLRDHLEHGKDWERMETPICGVYLIKFPAVGDNPAKLLLEIKPSFEIGMLLESLDHFKVAKNAITDARTYYLMEQVNKTNSKYLKKELKKKENRKKK